MSACRELEMRGSRNCASGTGDGVGRCQHLSKAEIRTSSISAGKNRADKQ